MPQPRPEFENPPQVFYNAREARRYHVSSRIQKVQRDMTVRALELMSLRQDDGSSAGSGEGRKNRSSLLLDVGCGSGISGEVLTERGHAWFGVDISRDMLQIAKDAELLDYEDDLQEMSDDGATGGGSDSEEGDDARPIKRTRNEPTGYVRFGPIHESDEDGDGGDEHDDDNDDDDSNGAGGAAVGIPRGPRMVEVMHSDIGQGLPFRPGSFDGCVSISVIQWLCHCSQKGEVPQRRLMAFFQSLYNALRRGAKAVLQFYPSTPDQVNMISKAAMKCGFGGGVVVDYPHSTKAKKYYLVLQAGQVAGGFVPPAGLTGEPEEIGYDDEEDDEEDEEVDEDEEGGGRSRIRVAGRDRNRIKRNQVALARRKRGRADARPKTGSKEWVLLKKAERRRRGYKTTTDSKYTMRPRKPRF